MALIDLWTTHVANNLSGVSNLNVENATAAGYKGHNSPHRPEEDVLIKDKSTTEDGGTAYFKGLEKPTTTAAGSMLAKSPFNETNIGKTDIDGFSSVYGKFPEPNGESVFSSENFTPHKTGEVNGDFVDGFSRGATGKLYDVAAALADYSAVPATDTEGDEGDEGGEGGEGSSDGAGDAAASQPGYENWRESRGGDGTVDQYMAEFGLTRSQVI